MVVIIKNLKRSSVYSGIDDSLRFFYRRKGYGFKGIFRY